ncbi:MAG: hypothetical protein WD059_15310 [Balneolaceae bacterium]
MKTNIQSTGFIELAFDKLLIPFRLPIISLFVLSIVIFSCGSPTGSSYDVFEGVPTGEIVPVEERDETLTGIESASANKQMSTSANAQKWWLQKISKIEYSGCLDAEDEDITLDNTYFAFKPDGDMYIKVGEDGTEQNATSWEWTDESKSAIELELYPDVEFELTSLNDDELVYASLQEGEQGCKAVTWEQFGDPIEGEIVGGEVPPGGNNGSTGGLIDDSKGLSDALDFEGGQKVQGDIPSPANTAHSLSGQEQYVITRNSSGDLSFEVGLSDANRPAAAVFLQLEGADEYFVVLIEEVIIGTESAAKRAGKSTSNDYKCAIAAPPCQSVILTAKPMENYEFPEGGLSVKANAQVYIPAAFEPCCDQLFGDNWEGQDDPDNWTDDTEIDFKAINVGGGAVQVTLTWNAAVDLDLHVTEPDGTVIYYADPQSPNTGGFLDYDDVEGYGPENIFYEQAPPSGSYQVEVVYFSGSVSTNYNVTVDQGGSVSTFTGTLSEDGETDVITTFQGGS